MDLIQSYHDDDDEEDQVVEGNAKADAPAAEAQRTTPREASSSSSEYYSTSSSEYYSTSSEGEGDDGAGGAAKDGGGGAASASDTESSASGVDGEEETARAASMIDNLLQSKGWEALNGDDSDEEADAGTSGPRTKNEVEPEVPAPLPADLVRDDDTLVEVGKVRHESRKASFVFLEGRSRPPRPSPSPSQDLLRRGEHRGGPVRRQLQRVRHRQRPLQRQARCPGGL